MAIVEDPILNVFCDHLDWVIDNAKIFDVMKDDAKIALKTNLRKAYMRHSYEIIYPAPGARIDHGKLSKAQQRVLVHSGVDIEDVMILTVNGTTASGHPMTTFGNTMRQHSYALFDLHCAGISKPWGS